MTEVLNVVNADELAEIENMLGDLDMPETAMVEAASAEPDTIIEPAEEPAVEAPITAAEVEEISQTVAEIEAEAAGEEADVEIDLEGLDEAVRDLEVEAAREAAYAEQEAVPEHESVAPADPSEKPAKKARAPKKAAAPAEPGEEKAAKAPRAPRTTLSDLPDTAFVLDTSVDEDPAALAENRAAVMARRPAQVKVAEKFDNVLLSVAAGRAPSTYTMDCYRALKATGRTSSAALAATLTATDKKGGGGTYTIGTARSQSGQFMALAPALKIATREGKELVLNPDSLIAMALDALIGA